jgi:predicted 2-oxoglutarate/Fe(II)-dependent dioxygenase YbiX
MTLEHLQPPPAQGRLAAGLAPRFSPGDPVPWFTARSSSNPEYHFGTVAGRHIVLLFLGSAGSPNPAAILRDVLAQRQCFDDERASLFILSLDPEDEGLGRVREMLPGVRVFWDDDAALGRRFGVAAADPAVAGRYAFMPAAVVLDPTLRVMRWFTGTAAAPNFAPGLLDFVSALPLPLQGPAQTQAPVIILPRVFEPELCRALIAHYGRSGGTDSGYMKHEGGQIRGVIDYGMKRRHDCIVEDEALRRTLASRITRRLLPEVQRVFRFDVTRMERYLVACYDAEVGGYFRPHRDNDGEGHRQFAVSINLNAEEYEGGDLRFPEYGRQTYRPPTGGACVFSCGLVHEATPVTRGRRFAFLPFLYDEAAARRREANNARYADPAKHYRYEGPLDAAAGKGSAQG